MPTRRKDEYPLEARGSNWRGHIPLSTALSDEGIPEITDDDLRQLDDLEGGQTLEEFFGPYYDPS